MREPRELVDHFFRHESGRLVALLTRSLGVSRLDLVEDVVQSALMRGLQVWGRQGVPEDPAGWLYRTARNLAVDALRRERTHERLLPRLSVAEAEDGPDEAVFAEEIGDEPLRLLFLCCHETIPVESRIALALRTVGGFSTPEIARALLASEANVQKRIVRAKERLRDEPGAWETPGLEPLRDRLGAVMAVVYLLFSEGHSAAEAEEPIRRELCDEARRLATMLARHPVGKRADVFALCALLDFHAARLEARVSPAGELIRLEEQDRSKWDWGLVRSGMAWMGRSAEGEELSRYHVEAAIAWEHCRARTFGETDWGRIVQLYDVLERLAPSPVHALNRAVATAYGGSPEEALRSLEGVGSDRVPAGYPMWPAVVGKLRAMKGDDRGAERAFGEALGMARGEGDRKLIRREIEECRRRMGETAG